MIRSKFLSENLEGKGFLLDISGRRILRCMLRKEYVKGQVRRLTLPRARVDKRSELPLDIVSR
jgi:hypothetical protein